MARINNMSFFRHLPNCVCKKCGNERKKFMEGKKVNGHWVPEEVKIEEFNNMIIERYEANERFHYRGKFTA